MITDARPLAGRSTTDTPLFALALTIIASGHPPRRATVSCPVPTDRLDEVFAGAEVTVRLVGDPAYATPVVIFETPPPLTTFDSQERA